MRQSDIEAAKWYRAAAEQGDARAQFNLGLCYENGEGVEQSYAMAVRWYCVAAEKGDVNAQFNLAVSYEKGQGVRQSYIEAVKWYRAAAEKGYVNAQFSLGWCYENGEGVEQSYTEAAKWYRAAAEQGDVRAKHKFMECCEKEQKEKMKKVGMLIFCLASFIIILFVVLSYRVYKKRMSRRDPFVDSCQQKPDSEPVLQSDVKLNKLSVESKMALIKDLFERGVMTEEEYKRKREAIVAEI